MEVARKNGMAGRVVVSLCLVSFLLGGGGTWGVPRGAKGFWLFVTRGYRAQIQVSRIGQTIPFSVLDEIAKAGESAPCILAIVMLESSGRPKATVKDAAGVVIAKGLMGVNPRHAIERGYTEIDLENPAINVRVGIEVLQEIRTRWPVEEDSVCVYNCGDAAFKKAIDKKGVLHVGLLPSETQRQRREYQKFRDRYRAYIFAGEGAP